MVDTVFIIIHWLTIAWMFAYIFLAFHAKSEGKDAKTD